ncbi:hypothetical protein BKP45_10630 [Anaerobacillus alkalidiazotrophicus]|uniref:Radical SAM core domain-containing protein n=1 Tax=Anaerobacillus alkalidiazotrophicus TaxID=472963 RepID=A0A1S2M034_9BACI|nr:radical SAM protein [Anaerobacillus alkalidiazotrophicus]OIJ18049.1 hypothetical protein BKP45_16345 [Anaerobacillus alkalidiazotrophicus]OIJ19528.1 hypothetical protein BKP45_10630 [Anaerobacillus alkalidiazotrophicus]
MLIVSNYTIFSTMNCKNKYIVHGYTGSVDLLEENVYSKLLQISKMKKEKQETLLSSLKDIDTLIERGYVVSSYKDEEKYYRIANHLYESRSMITSIVIVPSMGCNFRCSYCFELTDLDMAPMKKMELSVIDSTFKYIDKLETIKQITLFGGEPLEKDNYSIVDYIVNEGKKRNIQVNAVTNGYDLDSYIEIFKNNVNFDSIQVTLDGTRERHDLLRYLKNGSGTFNKIIKNIQMLIKEIPKLNITIRVNLSIENESDYIALKEYLKAKEILSDCTNVSIYNKCLHTAYINTKKKYMDKDITKNDDIKHDNLTYKLHRSQIKDLLGRNSIPFRTSVCGATGNMLVVTPNKNLFACWEQIQNNNKSIGKISLEKDNRIQFNEKYLNWKKRHVHMLKNCSKCKYSLFCGGGCPNHSEIVNNDMFQSYCQDSKIMIHKSFDEAIGEKINEC